MLKRIISLTFCAALGLHAQLVEKPAPAAEPKAKGVSRPAAAALHKPEAKPAKLDVLDRIKAPKTFRGALRTLRKINWTIRSNVPHLCHGKDRASEHH